MSLLTAGSASGLTPPEPIVRDPSDPTGNTTLTLEQAGILNPDGRQWAIALGKALFWDRQAGSDGNACASCHFSAGADPRLTNQLNPGFHDGTKGPGGDTAFGSERSDTLEVGVGRMPSGTLADSNYALKPADFPLHQLQDESDRNSPIRTTTNDRVSSQGAFDTTFTHVVPFGGSDRCSSADGSVFHAGRFAARQVEPRNTPTTVNSAFFHRNFWDGRANNLFNGVGVFGMRDIEGDPDKRLIVLNGAQLELGYLQIENASLASQAVGPPLSELEMSCGERSFADVGRKLLFTQPLKDQKILKTDSVLGPYVSASGKGLALKHLYAALIIKAFDKKYWSAPGLYKIENGQLKPSLAGHSQMATNFSMFWGISIMLYERSLVSDQSEVDTLLQNGSLTAAGRFGPGNGGCQSPTGDVDPLLLRGCTIFFRSAGAGADGIRGGNCFVCHNSQGTGPATPPLLSQAAFSDGTALMIRVGSQAGINHTHDQGFMSIGLRPVFTDLMSGGTDPYGNPLSFARQYWNFVKNGSDLPTIRNFVKDPALERAILAGTVINPAQLTLLGVDSASKSPILRNVALTPPYFSWGGYPSLRQALKTYNRGLNRRDIAPNPGLEAAPGTACTSGDNSGTGLEGNSTLAEMAGVTNCSSNTTGTILPLGLVDCDDPDFLTFCTDNTLTSANDDLAALERFLKGLTDPRVQCDQAPFDHPELVILNGHKTTDGNRDGKADDKTFKLPAVGKAGYQKKSGYCIPNAGDLFAPGMQSRAGGQKVALP